MVMMMIIIIIIIVFIVNCLDLSTDTLQPTSTAVTWISMLLGKYSNYGTNNANPIHPIGLPSQLTFLAPAQ